MYNKNDEVILKIIKNHKENVFFDEKYFLDLLKNSLSLELDQKMEILEKISQLTQNQINQLIEVFIEEREKFEKISDNDNEKERLKKERDIIWNKIIEIYS